MKKFLIILGIIVAVLAVGLPLFKKYTKSHCPVAQVTYEKDGASIKVTYCRPTAKGRVIFGEKSAGALQPFGEYWRVGANEATTFETKTNLVINGKELKAGRYSLYAIPGASNWTIAFNSNWDRWGAMAPGTETDVLRIDVPPNNAAPPKDVFEISFAGPDATGTTTMNLHWDKTAVAVPFQKK